LLRFSIGFIGIVIPLPALPSFGNFLQRRAPRRTSCHAPGGALEPGCAGRYYLLNPPDLLLIEWMHGDWPGGVRASGPDVWRVPMADMLAGAAADAPAAEAAAALRSAAEGALSIADHVQNQARRAPASHPAALCSL
jgi:hypothetical protein